MIKRTLDLSTYHQSFFLFGPRQVGKTELIKHTLLPDLYLDLLKQSEFLRYSRDVSLLSKEMDALKKDSLQVVIDEIQRCPDLLNEVHLILSGPKKVQFILTGSSARKLRKGGVNLLGGRAVTLHLHPFTHEELGENFVLEEVLRFGSLPPVILEKSQQARVRLLKGYVETYLKEEIQQEALTRNVPAFSRFLELAAFENGNLLNFNNLSREVGVQAKTVKEYFQILEDTLLGFFLYPYERSHRRKLVAHPKFFFFDPGVVAALKNQLSVPLIEGTPPFGDAFEHWVLLEMKRLLEYREREVRLSFFRTTDGAEVDAVIERAGEIWAVEIKSSTAPSPTELKGLRSFLKDHPCQRALCVCRTPRPYKSGNIEYLPWRDFLREI